jgi:hypothetical protein
LWRGLGHAHPLLLSTGATRRNDVMDMAQVFIIDLGWVFFIAWGTVLAAVSAVAFGRELLPFISPPSRKPEQR